MLAKNCFGFLVLIGLSQHSSSFSNKFGIPLDTGKRRSDSGHIKKPSSSTTCMDEELQVLDIVVKSKHRTD
jgi:hypothetical protein